MALYYRERARGEATYGALNAPVMRQMVSNLDYLYRLGVKDAYESGDDDGMCRDFLARHDTPGVYGFLTMREDLDPLEYQLQLHYRVRLTSMFGAMNDYFMMMRRYGTNFLSVYIPVAQAFYNMGIKDYWTAPYLDYETFERSQRKKWTEGGLVTISGREYVERVQLECFRLMRRDRDYVKDYLIENDIDLDRLEEYDVDMIKEYYRRKRVILKECHYQMFIEAVGLGLTIKYKKKGKWRR